MLLLTTTGRKTGAKRATPLIYQRHGDNYLVVASKGGGDPSGWFSTSKTIRTWSGRSKPTTMHTGARRHARGEARAVAQYDCDRDAARRFWRSGHGCARERVLLDRFAFRSHSRPRGGVLDERCADRATASWSGKEFRPRRVLNQ